MSNKCTFINPNCPWTSRIKMNCCTNKVPVSYFVELQQSNFPDSHIPWPFSDFSPALAEIPDISKFQKSGYSASGEQERHRRPRRQIPIAILIYFRFDPNKTPTVDASERTSGCVVIKPRLRPPAFHSAVHRGRTWSESEVCSQRGGNGCASTTVGSGNASARTAKTKLKQNC